MIKQVKTAPVSRGQIRELAGAALCDERTMSKYLTKPDEVRSLTRERIEALLKARGIALPAEVRR